MTNDAKDRRVGRQRKRALHLAGTALDGRADHSAILRTHRPESSACLTGQRNSKRSASIVRRRLQTKLSDRGLSPRMVASARSHDDAWNIRGLNTRWSKRSTRPAGNGRLSETVGHPEPELPSIEWRLSAQLNERSADRSEISNANRSARCAAPASI